jgi:hypothetical protein
MEAVPLWHCEAADRSMSAATAPKHYDPACRKESDIIITASSKQGRMLRGNSIQRLPMTFDPVVSRVRR